MHEKQPFGKLLLEWKWLVFVYLSHFMTWNSTLQIVSLPCLKLEHKNAIIP